MESLSEKIFSMPGYQLHVVSSVVSVAPIRPWLLACYKSVMQVNKPVKIDVFPYTVVSAFDSIVCEWNIFF